LDFSQAFIDAAQQLQTHGSMTYRMQMEGDIYQSAVAEVNPNLDVSKVKFMQGRRHFTGEMHG